MMHASMYASTEISSSFFFFHFAIFSLQYNLYLFLEEKKEEIVSNLSRTDQEDKKGNER